jgi:two-component system LytT family response regulator
VDDEPLARENLRLLLARQADVDAVCECRTGAEALLEVIRFKPDLALLDIRMPGIDGFGVAASIDASGPLVVFVTAFEDHARRAFDADAIDYLLKPFDDERFESMLARVRRRLDERRALAAVSRAYPETLVVREVGRVRLVAVKSIEWVAAEGVYCRLHHDGRSTLLRSSMDQLTASLDPERFVRIHRSAIVAIDRVVELRPALHGDYVVVLQSGVDVPLSRRRRPALATLLRTRRGAPARQGSPLVPAKRSV